MFQSTSGVATTSTSISSAGTSWLIDSPCSMLVRNVPQNATGLAPIPSVDPNVQSAKIQIISAPISRISAVRRPEDEIRYVFIKPYNAYLGGLEGLRPSQRHFLFHGREELRLFSTVKKKILGGGRAPFGCRPPNPTKL